LFNLICFLLLDGGNKFTIDGAPASSGGDRGATIYFPLCFNQSIIPYHKASIYSVTCSYYHVVSFGTAPFPNKKPLTLMT
jgi:hypothetical protein